MTHEVVDTPKRVVEDVASKFMPSKVQKWTKETTMNKVNIKVKSFDHALVDMAAKRLVDLAAKNNLKYSGPIPLPTKRKVVTILRSVHINKKSREQFESRTFQRLIVIEKASEKDLDQFKRFELPSGVEVQISTK